MIEQRLNDLESQISHHVYALEKLKEVVFEQNSLILKLEKDLDSLNARLNNSIKNSLVGQVNIGPGNEKPPHY